MEKITWQKGLFRIYILIGITGSIFLFPSSISYYKYRQVKQLYQEAEQTLAATETTLTKLRQFPRIDSLISRHEKDKTQKSKGSILDEIFSGRHYNPDRTRHRKISDMLISQREGMDLKGSYDDDLVDEYAKNISAMPNLCKKACMDRYTSKRLVADEFLTIAIFIITVPWIIHYLIKITLIPLCKWLIGGFAHTKPCKNRSLSAGGGINF